MKIVRSADLKGVGAERRRVRPGSLEQRTLAVGRPGDTGNFMFAIGMTQSDYSTPRHRHNFEQIRFQLRGEFDYDRDGKLKPGMVGYFPEGTFYGPSRSGPESTFLILQFGGASGSGYMSHDEYAQAIGVLNARGTFQNGVYTWVDSNGKKHNQDGYEAVWEESRQRKLTYPPPRYERPVFMHPANFDWLPSNDEPGVSLKALGVFGERLASMGFFRIDEGVTARRLPGAALYFVVRGSGAVGTEHWLEESAIHVDRTETIEIRATQPTKLFYVGLPDLSGLDAPVHCPVGKGTAARWA